MTNVYDSEKTICHADSIEREGFLGRIYICLFIKNYLKGIYFSHQLVFFCQSGLVIGEKGVGLRKTYDLHCTFKLLVCLLLFSTHRKLVCVGEQEMRAYAYNMLILTGIFAHA